MRRAAFNNIDGSLSTTAPRNFNPRDLKGLLLWLDSDAVAAALSTSNVAKWPDWSGNGNTFTQTSASNCPTVVLGQLNGHAAVRFDGVNSYMTLASMAGVPSAPFTAVVVMNPIDTARQGFLLNDSRYSYARHGGASGDQAVITTPGLVDYLSSTGFWVNGTPRVAFYELDSTLDARFWKNGKGDALFAGTTDTTGAHNTMYLGFRSGGNPTDHIKADLYTVMLFNRILQPWERWQLAQFLGTKYGITVTANVPTDVTGCKAWFVASDLNLNDGDRVSSWADRTGNSTVTQATYRFQPTYWKRGAGGKPIVRFDGVNDQLVSTTGLMNGPTSVSVMVACAPYYASETSNLMIGGPISISRTTSPAVTCDFFQVRSSAQWTTQIRSLIYEGLTINSLGNTASTVAWGRDELELLSAVATMPSGGAVSVYQNHVFKGTSSPWTENKGAFDGGKLVLGADDGQAFAGTYFKGDLAEAVVYDHNWTTFEQLIVDDCFARGYYL